MDGMEILYLLIPLSLVLVFVIGLIFWWMLKSGQFEDMEGPAHRILQDDDRSSTPANHILENAKRVDVDQSAKR